MIRYQVAARYSMALFQCPALNETVLQKRLHDLEEVEQRIDQNPKLTQFLYGPEFTLSKKEAFLRKILDADFDPLLFNFIFFLLKRKRLNYLSEITESFRQLVLDHLDVLKVDVMTAFPLDQTEKDALRLKIGKFYPQKEVAFFEEIDPNLIGGIIVIINRRIIDFSLKHHLEEMKEKLLAVPV